MQLLLMKRGGQVIYGGPLGRHSYKLVEYFEVRITFQSLSINHILNDLCDYKLTNL